ncbi:MAG: hypothetical protein PHI06_04805 [Desulfobulbaceae bacterium]|nr:hypothetical protein [Desulfobulbaceae bacterium]
MKKKYAILKSLGLLFVGISMLPVAESAWAATAPTDEQAQEEFLQAMQDRADGNLYDAVAAFNNVLTNNPKLHRARLELAVTYRRLYDYDKAKKLAQEVLDDPTTPPNVRVTIQAFLVQLDQDSKEMGTASGHYWNPSVSLGWLYDTNVNAGPSTDTLVDIATGVTQRLNPASQPTSDSAATVNAGLTHQYRPGKSFAIGGSNAILLWQNYLNYNRRDYTNEHAFDQDIITVATGPALVAVHNWRANLSAQADYIRLGSEDLAWFASLLPSFTKQFANDAWEITVDGGITKRDYQQEVDSEYDSTFYTGQLSIGYTFAKTQVSIQAGVSTYKEEADSNYTTYDGTGVYGAVAWRPWRSGSIFGRISERTMNYDAADTLVSPYARDERVRQYTMGASHTFKSNQKLLNDLTMAANFIRTDNYSNVWVNEFSREQTTLMLSKSF